MEISAAAQWINETFANFDYAIMEFFHNLNVGPLGGFFDFLLTAITRLGDDGIFLILLSLVLMVFKKTRKVGAAMLGAIIVGALFTNISIKPIIARPRPYVDEAHIFHQWWVDAGSHLESEFSFPSGHTTSAMAAMTGLFFTTNKKVSWTAFIFAVVMGITRIYLCVHFPSDVLGGLVVGFLAGLVSYLIVNAVYNSNVKFFKWLFEFDLFKKLKKS